MSLEKSRVVYALAIIALTIFGWFYLIPIGVDEMPVSGQNPLLSPRLAPKVFLAIAFAVACIMLVTNLIKLKSRQTPKPSNPQALARLYRAAGAPIIILAYVYTLPYIGAELSTVLLIVLLMLIDGIKRIKLYAFMIVLGIGIVMFFYTVLGVPLPMTFELVGEWQ